MKRAYFAVGFEVLTRVNQRLRPPICGHIMLLGADAKGISSVANVLLPDSVHALCYFRWASRRWADACKCAHHYNSACFAVVVQIIAMPQAQIWKFYAA